jgi:hypothetical protein
MSHHADVISLQILVHVTSPNEPRKVQRKGFIQIFEDDVAKIILFLKGAFSIKSHSSA